MKRGRSQGIVTRFDVVSGRGFVGRQPVSRTCSIQHSALRGTVLGLLEEGDRVEFDLVYGAGGASAENVRIVSRE